MPTCKISGQNFEISEFEKELREKLNAPMPDKLPKYVFQELAAFWHHFAIHKRKCDGTSKTIISVFDENCPYPVWERDYWVENANPPQAKFDFGKPFFDQLWELFQTCPIPHNIGLHNHNCGYTDDWWYSKNCYLCHSGVDCENCYYCYRVINLKDCMYCVFSFDSELSIDLINCFNCYCVKYALNCRNCRDSAFLFDCFNCHDCLFCWNLRNKKYCIFNNQYSKEEYESKVAEIHEKMKEEGSENQFFPKHFAASSYDESLAGFHWPLSLEEQEKQGYRVQIFNEQPHDNFLSPENIPDLSNEANEDICQQIFWDEKAKRQFQITKNDLDFCLNNKAPLPESFYIRRIKENFALLFCEGELRETTCAKTGKEVQTTLPDYLDGRILSREAYLEEIY